MLGFEVTNDKTRDFKPAGNSPECMSWDLGCARDLHLGVNRHCIYTGDLPDSDPRKFSLATPELGARAYKRVLMGCPSSKRIVIDHKKILRAYHEIFLNKGAIVEGLGNRRGVRGQSAAHALEAGGGAKHHNWGGARHRDEEKQRQALLAQWWHPDVADMMMIKVEQSLGKLAKLSVEQVEEEMPVVDDALDDVEEED